MKIKIGTRKSRLAVVQTQLIVKALCAHYPKDEFEVIGYSTKGDENLNQSLRAFDSKGVFIKELETALLKGEIDFAVHSSKDMPQILPQGLCIGAVTKRGEAADILLTLNGKKLCQMPPGTVIGTGSARRAVQLKEINYDVIIKDIRGNIDTRLEKLRNGSYDAIMLAKAAIDRLYPDGNQDFFIEEFSPKEFIPAAGQGILAIETASEKISSYLQPIHDKETMRCWEAERTFLQSIGGGCSDPSGAYAWYENQRVFLKTMVYQHEKIIRNDVQIAYPLKKDVNI